MKLPWNYTTWWHYVIENGIQGKGDTIQYVTMYESISTESQNNFLSYCRIYPCTEQTMLKKQFIYSMKLDE